MAVSPVVEWRQVSGPVVTSLALTGSGFSGAIPVGTTSTVTTLRVFNNFVGTANMADALTCVLAAYDDAIHDGLATSLPTVLQYVQVQVVNYNGQAGGADTQYYGIGGQVKHPVPTNSGTIAGSGAIYSNYITVNIRVVIPANAVQGSVTQGLWLEYSSTA